MKQGFVTVADKIEAGGMKAALGEGDEPGDRVYKTWIPTRPGLKLRLTRRSRKIGIHRLQAIDWLKSAGPFLPHISESRNKILEYDLPLFGESATYDVEDKLEHTNIDL